MKQMNIEAMRDTYVAFGSFDGVHKGHLALLKALSEKGKKDQKTTVVVSCYSPSDMEEGVLTTEEEKEYFIADTGVDCFISCNMEEDGLLREKFLTEVILGKLGAKVIMTAEHESGLEELKRAAKPYGCEVCTIEPVLYKDEIINSSLVRKYFMECRFEEVTQMCGHTYVMIGEIVHGKALGRTVGMPTANLGVGDTKLKPPNGVYATRSVVEGECYQGLTNIGTRPSVDDLSIITIETFLLDFAKDIYGKKLILEVHLFIRGVQKFDNLEQVQNQVQKDLAQVKDYLDSLS
ncbi:riboflavin kinase/FMN adenylyltransferase [Kineothrix alysoides]|uniref:Riboflavin biosynthesis protein n=1 Tax=Kineothrix alysoides TaxID=1469948 RepID=A0A4R1QPA4_9FIRM|nr:riboflavin kinase [Kineothrix alysoides]TCL55167.1 riboflavin kinase/FMN adenylyltransferase [Kineothrix alysoides]